MSRVGVWLVLALTSGACSGGGSSAPRGAAAPRDGAAVGGGGGGGSPAEQPEAIADRERAAGDEAEPRDDDADSAEDEPGTLRVQVAWAQPDAALLRSPGRNPCGTELRPPLQVEPAGVIADRYATERIVALRGAVVVLDGVVAPAASEQGATAAITVRGCALEPRAVAVAKGASLNLGNGDERRHELALTVLGQPTPLGVAPLPIVGHTVAVPLAEPGIVRISLRDDPATVAYAVVVDDASYAVVTDAAGMAVFHGLEPGSYAARVWHPPVAEGGEPVTATATVNIQPGGAARVVARLGQ